MLVFIFYNLRFIPSVAMLKPSGLPVQSQHLYMICYGTSVRPNHVYRLSSCYGERASPLITSTPCGLTWSNNWEQSSLKSFYDRSTYQLTNNTREQSKLIRKSTIDIKYITIIRNLLNLVKWLNYLFLYKKGEKRRQRKSTYRHPILR